MARKPILSPEQLGKASVEHLDAALQKGTDLECILLGVGYLEQALATLLRQSFVEGDQNDPKGDTEEGRMEMVCSEAIYRMDLELKCRLAYCLGLISEPIYKNLQTLRQIRNDCAHNYVTANFDSDKIGFLCDHELTIPADVDQTRYCKTRRAKFCTIVNRISTRLCWETWPHQKKKRKIRRPRLSKLHY